MTLGSEYPWGEFGKYNAEGIKGGHALAQEIERIVSQGGISSPVTTPRGRDARLHYLDNKKGGDEALSRHGISPRLRRAWEGGQKPSRAKLEALERAYRDLRRHNIMKYGRHRIAEMLNNNGRGRRVEIYPVDQSRVSQARSRDLTDRSIQARYIWHDAVGAWAEGDEDLIDEIWEDLIADLDSDWNAYEYVGAVSIGA